MRESDPPGRSTTSTSLETGKRRFSYRAVALLNSLSTDAIEQRPTGFARTAKVVLLNGQNM